MTEILLPQSVTLGNERPPKTNELTRQEKLEWAISSRLIQLSFKRPDLKTPVKDLLRLINEKMANKLEKNEYKEDTNTRFNLEKFQKATAKKLANFAAFAKSGRFKDTEAFELTEQILAKLEPEQANALGLLGVFVGDSSFPESKSPELE